MKVVSLQVLASSFASKGRKRLGIKKSEKERKPTEQTSHFTYENPFASSTSASTFSWQLLHHTTIVLALLSDVFFSSFLSSCQYRTKNGVLQQREHQCPKQKQKERRGLSNASPFLLSLSLSLSLSLARASSHEQQKLEAQLVPPFPGMSVLPLR